MLKIYIKTIDSYEELFKRKKKIMKKGIITRYSYIKKLYPNRLIIIKTKKGYTSFNKDKILLDYLINSHKIHTIDNLELDYLIVDNMLVVKERCFTNNNYYKYLKVASTIFVLENIKTIINQRVNF